MRINKFVALGSGISRRAADAAITGGRVLVNGRIPQAGQDVKLKDSVTLDGKLLAAPSSFTTIILNKPAGFVVSRDGQGAQTIYNLLPADMHQLKPIGRLDKDSSGLLLLTNDGQLAQDLTHPKHQKTKVYEVRLSAPLKPDHQRIIQNQGVQLDDGPSKFGIEKINSSGLDWRATLREGRNRQIRRTFAALGYTVTGLHRTNFGPYSLDGLRPGEFTNAKY